MNNLFDGGSFVKIRSILPIWKWAGRNNIVIHSWEITIRLRNRKDWENERKIINLNYFIWKKDRLEISGWNFISLVSHTSGVF